MSSLSFCLVLLLNLVALALGADKYSRDDFPPEFVFGSGTSAYQVRFLFYFLFFNDNKIDIIHDWKYGIFFFIVFSLYVVKNMHYERLKVQQAKMEGHLPYGIPSPMLVSFSLPLVLAFMFYNILMKRIFFYYKWSKYNSNEYSNLFSFFFFFFNKWRLYAWNITTACYQHSLPLVFIFSSTGRLHANQCNKKHNRDIIKLFSCN